jgi:hypothetical protein
MPVVTKTVVFGNRFVINWLTYLIGARPGALSLYFRGFQTKGYTATK